MSINLAATWNPRGELGRLLALLPQLAAAYSSLAIIFPPTVNELLFDELRHTELTLSGRLVTKIALAWPQGRYLSLKLALEISQAEYIHYADMDRLLRWVETRPEEWFRTLGTIQTCDVLVIGRTPAAYATHPQALIDTEAMSNQVVSHFLGRSMDVSAGSKGFCRRAVEALMCNAQPAYALGADAEWPILLHRTGFQLDYLEVDGLDWESADRYRTIAADIVIQQQAAREYDANPDHWAHRVAIAHEIIQVALNTVNRTIIVNPDESIY